MQQFLTPNIDPASESYIFSEVESKHVAKVLRKNVGDILNLTNGKGQLITAKLSLVSPKSCVVKLLEIKNIPVPAILKNAQIYNDGSFNNKRYTFRLAKSSYWCISGY